MEPFGVLAFDAGFVRWPDRMDLWVVLLLLLSVVPLGVAAATRPPEIPFNQLYAKDRATLGTAAWLGHRLGLVMFAALMLLVFVGMGLARI